MVGEEIQGMAAEERTAMSQFWAYWLGVISLPALFVVWILVDAACFITSRTVETLWRMEFREGVRWWSRAWWYPRMAAHFIHVFARDYGTGRSTRFTFGNEKASSLEIKKGLL